MGSSQAAVWMVGSYLSVLAPSSERTEQAVVAAPQAADQNRQAPSSPVCLQAAADQLRVV
jgi:hypothetical protein